MIRGVGQCRVMYGVLPTEDIHHPSHPRVILHEPLFNVLSPVLYAVNLLYPMTLDLDKKINGRDKSVVFGLLKRSSYGLDRLVL